MSKNDELLCRAKQKGTDDWVEGYYCKYERTNPDGSVNTTHLIVPYYASALYGIEVDPATVGRCTGLTDKNGKKIFEGDIVEYPIEQGKYFKQNIHEVVFERRHGTAYFGIKMSDIETWGFNLTVPAKLMKVIGNIHDNPELLKYDGD